MARVPLLVAAAAGGHRCLFDMWATAPSAVNWQEPLGQDNIPPWSSWSHGTKTKVLFGASLVFLIIGFFVLRYFCRDRTPQRWQRQQLPTVAEVPVADVELAQGDMPLTGASVESMLANLELLVPAADVDIAVAADMETAPAPEPAPTLKCTFSTAEGWAEGTCSVCLSDLVDGEKVRVLTACMHCFHSSCVETWLRRNATCPLCRAPTIVVPARGHRCRRPTDPNLSQAQA